MSSGNDDEPSGKSSREAKSLYELDLPNEEETQDEAEDSSFDVGEAGGSPASEVGASSGTPYELDLPDDDEESWEGPPNHNPSGAGSTVDTPYELDLPSDEEEESTKDPSNRGTAAPTTKESGKGHIVGKVETTVGSPSTAKRGLGVTSSVSKERSAKTSPVAASAGVQGRPKPQQLDRRMFVAGAGVLAIAVLIVGGLSWKASRESQAFEDAMSQAREAFALDMRSGYRETEEHLRRALEIRPNAPEALGLGALTSMRVYTSFARDFSVRDKAEDYLALAEPQSRLAPEAAAARAITHLLDRRPADAVSTLSRALVDAPGHPALLWVRAQAEIDLDRQDLAMATLEPLRNREAAFIPALVLLADLLAEEGARAEAAQLRIEILRSAPHHLASLSALMGDIIAGRADPNDVLDALLEGSEPPGLLDSRERCRIHLKTARIATMAGRATAATMAENRAIALDGTGHCPSELVWHMVHRRWLTTGGAAFGWLSGK